MGAMWHRSLVLRVWREGVAQAMTEERTAPADSRTMTGGQALVSALIGEGIDTMYAHLREPASVQKGDRIHTGDPIGYVGDTGDADGCHLHFEEWSAPGWSAS